MEIETTHKKAVLICIGVCGAIGLVVGLAVGLTSSSSLPHNPVIWAGCTDAEPYSGPDLGSHWQYTGYYVGLTGSMKVDIRNSGALPLRPFQTFVNQLFTAFDEFTKSLLSVVNGKSTCDNQPYLPYICNSTYDSAVCEKIVAYKNTFLNFTPRDIHVDVDTRVVGALVIHNDTYLLFGQCGAYEPAVFTDIKSNASGGGSLAQWLYGVFEVPLCDGL